MSSISDKSDTIELHNPMESDDSWVDGPHDRKQTEHQFGPDDLFTKIQRKPNVIGAFIKKNRDISKYFRKIQKWKKPIIYGCLTAGYVIYFGFAMSEQFGYYPFPFPNGNYILFILTLIALLFVIWDVLLPKLDAKYDFMRNISEYVNQFPFVKAYTPIVAGIIFSLAAIVTLLVFMIRNRQVSALQSIAGLIILYALVFITSEHPEYVSFRAVLGGFLIQFWLGFFVLQTDFGYDLIKWIADRAEIFLNFSQVGAEFVYASLVDFNAFAINVLSIIIYMSAVVSLLYYMGWMQWVIAKLAWILSTILTTSPCESINSAANIFLGQSEAPLLIKPFIVHMTPSELFAIMVGGFASVSGSVLGAFISFGVPSAHLVTACVMAAPGALALSKLAFPETKQTGVSANLIKSYKDDGSSKGYIDALLQGATIGLQISGAVLCSLIAILSVLGLVDSLTQWFFAMVHHPEINFQVVLGYLFYPIVYFIGLDPRDCLIAGRLFGMKTVLNEFVAFDNLGKISRLRNEMIENNTFMEYDCGYKQWNSSVLMMWNTKSIDVMTYALCGFANFSSIGIQIGSFSILAPTRRNFFTRYVFKAMVIGISANIVTACIASILYNPASDPYVRNCSQFTHHFAI